MDVRDRPVMPDPRVTTVVMTRDRWPELSETLRRHELPVIVVDNGSADLTAARVRRGFPDVSVIELGRNLGAVARNIGVQRAATPYVAFADDDSWWAPGSLDRAADLFEAHPRLALVAARVLVGPEERLDPVSMATSRAPLGERSDLPGPDVLGFLACGCVVRRSAFLAVGGFSELLFFMGEEELLALDLAAAGWGLSHVDDVVAHHHPSLARGPLDRQARAERNQLLTALLRRPWPVVGRTLIRALRHVPGWMGAAQCLPLLPRALRQRRLLPPAVEAARRRLDRCA